MTVSTRLCGSWQAAAITSRPVSDHVRSRRCSTGNGRLQQSVLVKSIQQRHLCAPDKSTMMSGELIEGAGPIFWRSSGMRSSTCISQAGIPAGSPAETIADDITASIKPSSPALGTLDIDDVKVIDKVRGLLFWFTTIGVAAITFSAMLLMHPLVLAFDKNHRIAHHIIFHVWATVSTNLFYRTEIEGLENLPPADAGAVVYVANHQSSLDIYAPYQIRRPFKYVSTTGAFRIPFVGGMMHLTDYIPLDRKSTKSQVLCLKKCMKDVREGSSVILFPEGGRSTDGSLAAFKKGAFSVAAKEGVPVVPITIIGTSKLMPKGFNHILTCGSVKIVVHPPIRGKNANELCEQSRKIIAETLVKYGYPLQDQTSL